MRIPLDYYRILGLPIQATAEQLEQAYRDRMLQLPRREYSENAIQSRKQLIDEAFAWLSDPIKRKTYDDQFLSYTSLEEAKTGAQSEDTYGPSIEIDQQLLTGALLILLELGEYELVIRLGRPYLSSGP
ncbi:MAG: J domain-containing protein, partial [Leptolyngbya sp. SIO4C1]|nr:J domain-containing protein [Leptolyngbya sp. SIO4C1]